MSTKRSRAAYETDLHAPFATFGTPLPDDNETRDDGSYLPLWKQEVRDERGRKRLHGAFTGGWSAGYFNTVGSKEGWTPSTFVSSRTNRHKDGNKRAQQQRPEDYMDDEDLADAAESQKIQTSQAFAGLGASTQGESSGKLMGLFKTSGDTMGLKLLCKMGWKDGQGIGPKVRRSARLGLGSGASNEAKTHLFAPEDAAMVEFVRKVDRKGLGYQGEARLSTLSKNPITTAAVDENEEGYPSSGDAGEKSWLGSGKSKSKSHRGGMGVGILNDTGSDDEDPYEIGPKIKYNRVIGGEKKKKKAKKPTAGANPALKSVPVFVSRSARAGNRLGRCHDGRLPLDGFILAQIVEDLTTMLVKYAPPPVPADWKSAKASTAEANPSSYMSTAEAAKTSTLDAKSRAAILGEKTLPGKSVFDFLSNAARDRLATGSGKQNLPPGLGETPKGYAAISPEERQQALWNQAPQLDRETAMAAISRGSSGPYADDESKKARYRTYLEHFATGSKPLPSRPRRMADDDFLRELNEFFNCARIFKPMTGFMASRFTTGKTAATAATSDGSSTTELLSKPELKAADPAEDAAKLGMYGKLTRSTENFYPTRLLCKRFNVKPPAHSRQDQDGDAGTKGADIGGDPRTRTDHSSERFGSKPTSSSDTVKAIEPAPGAAAEARIEPGKNEAVEGETAHDDVLRAIFGDSDSE